MREPRTLERTEPKDRTESTERTEHPRDTFITVFGRQPVLEALQSGAVDIRKVFIEHDARGGVIDRIEAEARRRGAEVERVNESFVHRISRNAKQDQGVAADVRNPKMQSLTQALSQWQGDGWLLALDGVTNPVNVGMILRSAAGLGCSGVVIPRQGCPEISPLLIKASAGVAYRAPILRCERLPQALESLKAERFSIYALDAGRTRKVTPLPQLKRAPRAVFVLGNETTGISERTETLVDEWVGVPMQGGVESLNVACTAAILCYALGNT